VPPSPEDPVCVHGVQEEYFYMMVHPCACGGAWRGDSQEVEERGGRVRHRVAARCPACKAAREFHFEMDARYARGGPIRQVNPTGDPSAAIDLAEWMDLARFYLGRIEHLTRPVEKAQSLLDARHCLEEALKFYAPGDEGPPPSALWSDASRAKAARQAEVFRRSTLRKMLDRIPPMERLRQADSLDQKAFDRQVRDLARREARRAWWQFWKIGRKPQD
jgi:hypothetical protein